MTDPPSGCEEGEPCRKCDGDVACDGEVHECGECGDHAPCPEAY